jgi:FixJ family two-component response regulator
MNNPSATLFIVDDDPDVRRALDRLLQSSGYNVQTYSSSREFLAAHDPARPGCAILDLAMPDVDGLQLQASLVASGCSRPVVFLSGNGSIATSVTAMRAGAVTFLTKPIEHRLLIAAIEEGLRLDAAERANQALQRDIVKRIESLTPRERQVFSHVVAGRLNKQIAADLGTVVKTIKVHRARVMHKMGVRSVAQLTRLAASVGIELPLREFTNNRRSSDAPDEICVLRTDRIPQLAEGKSFHCDVGRGSF